jgi:D-alanyl-lipoteichoic acid acyltransferase DltB (MBOAT superfamily)
MNVASATFLVGLLVLASLIFFLPRGSARQLVLAACNTAFLAFWISGLASWVILAAFVGSGYLFGRAAQACAADDGARTRLLTVYIASLIAGFVILRKYQFLDVLLPASVIGHSIVIVGLSYMLFRQIHFVVDMSQGQIERPSLWDYLNYQLDFFTLLAGPIQRYDDFVKSWHNLGPLATDWYAQLNLHARLLVGILKVALVGALLLKFADSVTLTQLHANRFKDLLKFAVLFYGYPAYIYFNFSGYCDIVIAGAALVGIRLPENFNQPYLARNVIDFWARWHMSLTHWIRDYVFTPLYKHAAESWPTHARSLQYPCYFTALFLAGVWHGASWNFVLFGLLHGTGVAVTKMWEENIVRRRGRAGLREYLRSGPIRLAATFATVHFVCFTLLFFEPGLQARVEFLRRFVTEAAP